MVLANFVDSLPRPDVARQAEYVITVQNKQFVCEVILPEGSPIRGSIGQCHSIPFDQGWPSWSSIQFSKDDMLINYVGRPASTKQVAKCSAAFDTCLELVKAKYLNEWLLSTFTKQLPAMRNALLAVSSKKREAYPMKTKPRLWSFEGAPEQYFLTVRELSFILDCSKHYAWHKVILRLSSYSTSSSTGNVLC